MSNSISYDQAALEGAIAEMGAGFTKLSAKLDDVVSVAQDIGPNWDTVEGRAFFAQLQNISNAVAACKASYSSMVSFLGDSVSVDYSKIEAEIAAAIAGTNQNGGDQ